MFWNVAPKGFQLPTLYVVLILNVEKALTESLIRLVSLPQVDPNFLELSARDRTELYEKRKAQQGHMLSSRQVAIERYLAEAKARLPNPPSQPRSSSPTREERLVELLTQKAASNAELLAIYNGEADDERRQQFIDSSVEAWCVHLPTAIRKLEALMVGPFALGDDLVSFPSHNRVSGTVAALIFISEAS